MYKIVWIAFILLLAWSGYDFMQRSDGTVASIDEYKAALNKALPFIKQGSQINFYGSKEQVEGLIWSRNVLFPMRIDRIQDFDRDTTLMIFDLDITDSLKATYLGNKSVFWQYRDHNREYLLATVGTKH